MVVQCEVQVIVMASNETEGGQGGWVIESKHKCECYWVCDSAEDRQFGDVLVSFVKCRQVCPDFLVRTLKITFTNDHGRRSRVVCQFHYSLWPDHGVPGSVRPLLAMVRLVRECQASETLPLLVHCSAGCGRTGTICAIDHVWTLMRTGRLPERVDLLVIVKEMRRQRVAMVQTRDQYILLHRAVRRLFHDRLALIDDHPYANVALDGTPLGCGVPKGLGGEGGFNGGLANGTLGEGSEKNGGQNNNSGVDYEKIYCDRSSNDSSMDLPSNSLHFQPRPSHNQPHPPPPPLHPHPMLPSPIPVLRPPSPLQSPLTPHGHSSLHPNMSSQSAGPSAFRAPGPMSGSRSPGSGPLPQFGSGGYQGPQKAVPSPTASNNCHSQQGNNSCSPSVYGSLGLSNNTTPTGHAGNGDSTGRPTPSNAGTPIAPFYVNFSDSTSQSNGGSAGSADIGGGFPTGTEPSVTVDETDRRSGLSQIQLQQYLVAKYSSPNSTPYSTPLGTPGSTPAVTPNSTPNPLQGIGGNLLSPPNPPTPPTRSQTPSPVIALNKKAYDSYTSAKIQRLQQQQQHQQHQMSQLQQQQQTQHQIPPSHYHQQQQPRQEQHKYASNSFPCETKVRKGSELTRRPSIQKLREMFETNKNGRGSFDVEKDSSNRDSSTAPSSNVKLSRSASSVTLRNSSALSLHSDKDAVSRGSRLRRKAGLGSEESLNMLHFTSVDHPGDNDHHLVICPPPPPLYDHHRRDDNGGGSAIVDRRLLDPSYPRIGEGVGNVRSCKPPSSPIHTSPNTRRRNHPSSEINSSANSRLFTTDERPALPIKIKKKSKSFRYTREPPTSATMAGRSPELGRKCGSDSINTYFSLDRAKNEISNGSASGISLCENIGSSRSVSSTSVLNRGEAVPSGGDLNSPRDGFKLSVFQQSTLSENGKPRGQSISHSREDVRPEIPPKKYVQDRFRMSQSMTAAEDATCSPLNAEHKFTETVIGHRHQLVSTYDNSPVSSPMWKSPQSSDSEQSLYDQLPCSHGSSKHPLSSLISKSQEVARNSSSHLQQVSDPSRPGKEYVNAQLVHTPDLARGEKRVYLPIPARRTTTDIPSSNHDYANFSVNEKDQLSMTVDVEVGSSKLKGVDVVDFDRRQSDASHSRSSASDPASGQAIKPTSSSSFLRSMKELQKLTRVSAKSLTGKNMYEPVDFGENSDALSEEEVVEVVNRELVGDNYRDETTFSCSKRDSDAVPSEVLLRNSLDPIARQVYQDCEEYLLYGNNKSPVPSLMPKHDSNSLKSTRSSTASRNSELLLSSPPLKHLGVGEAQLSSSSHGSSSNDDNTNRSVISGEVNSCSHAPVKGLSNDGKDSCLDASMDMTEVKNKVNVTPQGLRTRERRNSYRQAVNHVVDNWRADKVPASTAHQRNHDSFIAAKLVPKIGPNILESAEESSSSCSVSSSSGHTPIDGNHKKIVNKYETIWFEKTRETSRSDENLRLTRSVVEDTFMNRKDGGGFLDGPSAARTPSSGPRLGPTTPLGEWDATFVREKKVAVTPENGQMTPLGLDRRDDLPGFVNSLERSRLFAKDTSDGVGGNKSASPSAGSKNGNSSDNGDRSGHQQQKSSVTNCDSSSSSSGDSNNVNNSLGAILSSSCGLSKTENEPIYVNTTELRAAVAHQQQQHRQPQSMLARTFVKTGTAPQHHLSAITTPLLGPSTPDTAANLSTKQVGPDHPTTPQQASVQTPTRDADSFPLISKPLGPCPTTPTKQPSRTPSSPYMKIPQPKGLGSPPGSGCISSPEGTKLPFNSSSNSVGGGGSSNNAYKTTPLEVSNYHHLPTTSSSHPYTDSGNYTMPSDGHHKKVPDYLIKSRSLPPPPPQLVHQKKQQDQQQSIVNNNSSVNRKFGSHHPLQQQNASSSKFSPTVDPLEPIYNVPFDQKKEEHSHQRPFGNSSNKYPSNDRSPYHSLSQVGRGPAPITGGHQRGTTTNMSSPQQQSVGLAKGGHLSRALQSTMQQPTRAHIVGDIAIVGDAAVKLRRARPGDATSTPDAAPPASSFGGTPVAPPRVKRHSSTGGRDSSSEGLPSIRSQRSPGGLLENRCGTISPPLHRKSTCTADWGDRSSPPPPALPAKTAALHLLLPPPVPPATPPAPPSTSTTNSAASTTPTTTTTAASNNLSPIPPSHHHNNKYYPSTADDSNNGNSTYQSLINNNNSKNLNSDDLYSLSPTAVNNMNNVNHDLFFKSSAVSRRSAVDDSALVYSFSGSSNAQNNNNSVNISSKNNSITNAQKRFSYHSSSNNSPSNTIGSVNSSNNINNSGSNIHSHYHHNHNTHHQSLQHQSSSDSSSPHSPSKQPSSSSLSSKNGGGHDGGYSPISGNHSSHYHHHPHHHSNNNSSSNHRKSSSNINNITSSHHQHHHSPYHHPPPPKLVPISNTNGGPSACSPNSTNHKRASADFSSYKGYTSNPHTPSSSNRTQNHPYPASYTVLPNAEANNSPRGGGGSSPSTSPLHPNSTSNPSSCGRPRNHLLQRSMTSSAILINSNRSNSNTVSNVGGTSTSVDNAMATGTNNSTSSNGNDGGGNENSCNNRSMGTISNDVESSSPGRADLNHRSGGNSNGGLPSGRSNNNTSTNLSNCNGGIDGSNVGSQATPQSSYKFSGLLKKIRSGVTPSRSNTVSSAQPAKQSFVHPVRFGGSDGRSPPFPNSGDNSTSGQSSDGKALQSGHNVKTKENNSREEVVGLEAQHNRLHSEDRGGGSDERFRVDGESDRELARDSNNVKQKGTSGKSNGGKKYGFRSKESKGNSPASTSDANHKPTSNKDKASTNSSSNSSSSSSNVSNNKKASNSNNSSKVKFSVSQKESPSTRFHNLVSPTSPKPLVRALGKLKFLRGAAGASNSNGGSGGCVVDGAVDGGDDGGVGRNNNFNPLQKSASVGHNVFTSVVQDCGFPRSPKLRTPSNSPPPARQHYL